MTPEEKRERSAQVTSLVDKQREREVNLRVEDELERLRVRETARKRFAAESDPNREQPVDAGWLGDMLARGDDTTWRIERLLPAGGRALIIGQAKAGKSKLALNIARSLLVGVPLLDRFAVVPLTGNVAYCNYEMVSNALSRWADQGGVPHDRFLQINLRGRRNPLAGDRDDQDELARVIRAHDAQILIVDCFGPAYTGDQNNAGEVRQWLAALDQLTEAAGCTELILLAHAGHESDRVRGSSALNDWPDVLVHLTRDGAARYVSAIGRDVDLPEDRVEYDAATGHMRLTGAGDRNQASANEAELELAEILTDHDELSGRQAKDLLTARGIGRNAAEAALKRAVAAGWVEVRPGERNAMLHRIRPGSVPPSRSVPGQWRTSSVPPSIEGDTSALLGQLPLREANGTVPTRCVRCSEPSDQLEPDTTGAPACPDCRAKRAKP